MTKRRRQAIWAAATLIYLLAQSNGASAAEVVVAVATNFVGTTERLKEVFENAGGDTLKIVSAATGKHVAQIVSGAPFDVFLSADDKAAAALVKAGFALASTEFTYAIGRLVLWSGDPDLLKDNAVQVLRTGNFRKIAYPNPKLAPYGKAAEAALGELGILDGVKEKVVMGENVGQTFAMIATGGVELGFIALSQFKSEEGARGSAWVLPKYLHEPIRQNAILLTRAKDSAAARSFLDFLKSNQAQKIISEAGYDTD
jgi:molybdate transport system substrate-binding protein